MCWRVIAVYCDSTRVTIPFSFSLSVSVSYREGGGVYGDVGAACAYVEIE